MYDRKNQLIRPSQAAMCRARISLDLIGGATPTFDRDHVHVFVVTASGITVKQARQRAQAHMERFAARTDEITGYRRIATRRTQGRTLCNRNITITHEILYAVELPAWARGRRTPAPSMATRDVGA
ncbi:hypothetical protein CVV72_10710 [Amycolatopsis sp. TNS106]|nr:hypothetical protein CVV72_10710 [Amycolatopsis sp. TNS106]